MFDACFHVVAPGYSLVANGGYVPDVLTLEDYRVATVELVVVGGALVSASFQGIDQSSLVDALGRSGPGRVGVSQPPVTVTDDEVLGLHARGVRAVRFTLRRGSAEVRSHLDRLARRVHELAGWHADVYVDTSSMDDLVPTLGALPRVSIDHLPRRAPSWRRTRRRSWWRPTCPWRGRPSFGEQRAPSCGGRHRRGVGRRR